HAYAGNGPVSIAAHTDSLEMLADQAVTVQSVDGHVAIHARKKIAIVAGKSAVTLEGGNITFSCPGQFAAKGAQRVFEGAASKAAVLPRLPDPLTKFENYIEVNYRDPDGAPMAGLGYTIRFAGGASISGKLVNN